jgi:hypothetical protein
MLGATLVGATLFYDVVLALEHGGVFSIISALSAVDAKAPVVNIDTGGLRLPTAALLCFVIFGFVGLVEIDLSPRWMRYILAMGTIFLTLMLDGAYGRSTIGHFMTAHGYRHCPSGDYSVGRGKSFVEFDNYVRTPTNCRGGVSDVREPHFGRNSGLGRFD